MKSVDCDLAQIEQALEFAQTFVNWQLGNRSYRNLSKQFPGLLPEAPFGSFLYIVGSRSRLKEDEQQFDYLCLVQARLREVWTAPDEWSQKHLLAELRVDEGRAARDNCNRERRVQTPTVTLAQEAVPDDVKLDDGRSVRVRRIKDVKRHRDWTVEDSRLLHTIPQTGFHRVLDVLDARLHRLKVCENPECPGVRYFIGKRSTQRYCSPECAEVFQREAKRKWWEQHGQEWRNGREQQKLEKSVRTGRQKRSDFKTSKQVPKKGR
jgi:hypothetical protein